MNGTYVKGQVTFWSIRFWFGTKDMGQQFGQGRFSDIFGKFGQVQFWTRVRVQSGSKIRTSKELELRKI